MACCPAVAQYLAEHGATDPVSRAAISGLVSEGHRLAHERRRHALAAGRNVESCDELDVRWKRLGADCLRGLRDGASPESTRSDFAGRFPFLGLVDQRHLERCRERQRSVIERLRSEGLLFLPVEDALLHPLEPEEPEEDARDEVDEVVSQVEGLPDVADLPDPLADIDLSSAISALTAAATAASAAEAQAERGPLLRLSEPVPVVEEEDADVFHLSPAISALTAAATAASAAEAQAERGPLLRLSEPVPVVEEEDADVFQTGSVLASFVQELSAGAVAAGIWAPTSKISSDLPVHNPLPFYTGTAW